MEQMELREELEETYKQQLIEIEKELNEAQWTLAADRVRKLKFIAKLKHEIELVEERLLG